MRVKTVFVLATLVGESCVPGRRGDPDRLLFASFRPLPDPGVLRVQASSDPGSGAFASRSGH